jgi:hypothetical protein
MRPIDSKLGAIDAGFGGDVAFIDTGALGSGQTVPVHHRSAQSETAPGHHDGVCTGCAAAGRGAPLPSKSNSEQNGPTRVRMTGATGVAAPERLVGPVLLPAPSRPAVEPLLLRPSGVAGATMLRSHEGTGVRLDRVTARLLREGGWNGFFDSPFGLDNQGWGWCLVFCVIVVAPTQSAALAGLAGVQPASSPPGERSHNGERPSHAQVSKVPGSTWYAATACYVFCYDEDTVGPGESVNITVNSPVAGGAPGTLQSPPRGK